MDEKIDERIRELKNSYPIEERFQNLLEQIQDTLIKMGIIDQVAINTELLGKAVIDYFEDIDRLKKFEEIDLVNVSKIYSYGTFWVLRRHPIQIIDSSIEQRFWYVNEKVCIAIMIPKMLAEMNVKMTAKNPQFRNFLDLMYYNFKYRLYSQKTLEFMVAAFFCGYSIKKEDDLNEQTA